MKPMTISTILSLLVLTTLGAAPAFAARMGTANVVQVSNAPAPISRDALDKLVGRSVQNAQGEKIGEIGGIYVNRDGTVKRVVVGVGGFLGLGEHDVALGWDNLHFSDEGRVITVHISKKELKAMPKYEYANVSYRGTVFGDRQ